jgi:hypothetical protein
VERLVVAQKPETRIQCLFFARMGSEPV